MSRKRKGLLIAAAAVLGGAAVFAVVLMWNGTRASQDITADDAVRIAQEYVDQKYEEDFQSFQVSVLSKAEYLRYMGYEESRDECVAIPDCDFWVIGYGPAPSAEDEYVLDGGGPLLYIEKATGKVLLCVLQA